MNKINFENGTLIEPAKVTINGVTYNVIPEEWSTNTPLSAETLNQLQYNIEDAINALPSQIIENGSNTSANYVKYSDGTLIQYGKVNLQTYNSRSAGGLTYWSASDTVVLPSNYINTEYIVLTNVPIANLNIFTQSNGFAIERDQIQVNFMATNDEENRNIHFMTIGRWK